ncbi:hypothetical protein D3C77_641040 [compost metagenome]
MNGDVGMAPTVLGEQPGKQRVATKLRQAKTQLATTQLAQVIEFIEQFLAHAQHNFASFQHNLAGRRQV